jgi:hypothetical protein
MFPDVYGPPPEDGRLDPNDPLDAAIIAAKNKSKVK